MPTRWTARRKLKLIQQLDEMSAAGAHMAVRDLLAEHDISAEELATWRSYLARASGPRLEWQPLLVTRVQDFRRGSKER